MYEFFYHDRASLQSLLEYLARNSNTGVCESYNYCEFCEQPREFCRRSETPCADAFLKGRLSYVKTVNSYGKKSHQKFVTYKKKEDAGDAN